MSNYFDWTDERKTRLRILWAEGASTVKIARHLGVSKNAVIGKVHRMDDIPGRPSPIRPATAESIRRRSQPSRQKRPKVTLPPLRHYDRVPPMPVEQMRQPSPRHVIVAAPRQEPTPSYGRVTACCWPIGEPRTRGFRFCEEPSAPGRPYCTDHAEIAYVKVRDRREDVVAAS